MQNPSTPAATQPTRILRPGPDFRWPGGARIAMVFNIAYEGWSDGKTSGIGPMGNVLAPGYFDTNAHSWGQYGPLRGIHRLLDIADQHGIATSVMTNGILAERFPETVKMIHGRGHEIVAHSYGMDVIPVYLKEDEERANIARCQSLVQAAAGMQPPGWISPRVTGSPITPRLLAEAGFLWHGDCNDDDLPHIAEYAGAQRIVGIPFTMDVNDMPSSVRYGNPPRAMLETFRDAFGAMLTREKSCILLDVTAHTHVFGRPAGAWVFDEIMAITKRHAAAADAPVWIGTRIEIARHMLAQAAQLIESRAG